MLTAVFWHPIFGDLRQSEKLSEIQLPLVEVLIFFHPDARNSDTT
jgi:hypothetical protein